MAYKEGGYKNPKIPRNRDKGQAPSAGTMAPVAPGRGRGLMQRAAVARVRQTKPGQPPIPTPAVPTPMPSQSAAPKPIVTTDPAQRRDELERERLRLRQQEEQRKRAEEQRKKAELLQAQQMPSQQAALGQQGDYRQQALQRMADAGGALPGLEKPGEDESGMQAMGGGPGGQGIPGVGLETGLSDTTPEGVDEDAYKPSVPQDEPTTGLPEPTKYEDSPAGSDVPAQGLKDAAAQSDDIAEGKVVSEEAVESYGSKQWFYGEDGEKIGYKDVNGNFYAPDGTLKWQAGDTEFEDPSKGSYDEGAFKDKFPGKYAYKQAMDKFSDWLNQSTGIPEDVLQGQIAQVHMQSSDQIAKFANMMAARGVGASGLMGAGMGQIASQAVAAIANIKFENEKLKIEEQLNKMKTAAALAGQWMSEENRMKIFEHMNKLDQEKFDWQKQQDENANFWADLNDTAALLQAEEGWEAGALGKAQEAQEAGWSASEVQKYLYVNDDDKVDWKGPSPKGSDMDPALTKQEGEEWGALSESQQDSISKDFHGKWIGEFTGTTPSAVEVQAYMEEWYGWNIDLDTAQSMADKVQEYYDGMKALGELLEPS